MKDLKKEYTTECKDNVKIFKTTKLQRRARVLISPDSAACPREYIREQGD